MKPDESPTPPKDAPRDAAAVPADRPGFLRRLLGGGPRLTALWPPYLALLTGNLGRHHVQSGPFRGMLYGDVAHGSVWVPKILGTYELELHDFVESLCRWPLGRVIDIGAAEGYYAVGFARRLPSARVITYECSEEATAELRRMAGLNGVQDRIICRGMCGPESLDEWGELGPGTLVLCDAEGAERWILDPRRNPSLARCWILVETHDFVEAGVQDELVARFSGTHAVTVVTQRHREAGQFPVRSWLTAISPPALLRKALGEHRPARNGWLWMTPRTVPADR